MLCSTMYINNILIQKALKNNEITKLASNKFTLRHEIII
jgi:hypothetical protein